MTKKPVKLIVTLSVDHSDGPEPETYDALAEHLAEEWDGLEVYFQDPGEEEETSVHLSVGHIEVVEG